MNKTEAQTKKFFNERIINNGWDKFSSDIGDNPAGKMIFKYLATHMDIEKRILDAGCGEGRFTKPFIMEGVDIVGMDFAEEYVKMDRAKLKGVFVVGSVTNIPFKEEHFDYVFCVDVLQHVLNLDKALSEFHRVLKKGGTLFIIDKNKYGLHRKYLIPERLIQKYKELTQKRYRGFKERWFKPEELKKKLSNIFQSTYYEYLIEENKAKIFHKIPQLNLFVVWSAKK